MGPVFDAKRPKAVLIAGAGLSNAVFGVPVMSQMHAEFPERAPSHVAQAYRELTARLEKTYAAAGTGESVNCETVLSVLQHEVEPGPGTPLPAALLNMAKRTGLVEVRERIGPELLEETYRCLQGYLVSACDVRRAEPKLDVLDDLLGCCLDGREPGPFSAARQNGTVISDFLPVFTTNYDVGLERYCARSNVLYRSGERREYPGNESFSTPRLELARGSPLFGGRGAGSVRIHHLHGAVTWYQTAPEGELFWTENPVEVGGDLLMGKASRLGLVYPIYGKTARAPFTPMFEELDKAIQDKETDTLLIVGHSMSDEYLADCVVSAGPQEAAGGQASSLHLVKVG